MSAVIVHAADRDGSPTDLYQSFTESVTDTDESDQPPAGFVPMHGVSVSTVKRYLGKRSGPRTRGRDSQDPWGGPHCMSCGRNLRPGVAAYRIGVRLVADKVWGIRERRKLLVVCKSCVDLANQRGEIFEQAEHVARCSHCERTLRVPSACLLNKRHFCCRQCELDYWAGTTREARALEDRPCVECSATFTPKRKDSIYCGPACKQRAYRKRVAA